MREFTIIRAEVESWHDISAEMLRLQQLRINDEIPDTLIFVEHPEIVTVGPKARRDGVVVPDSFETTDIDRGGGITWHGKGQLTIYPIFKWNLEGENSVPKVTEILEGWVIDSLKALGIEGSRDHRMQGVWIDGKKISSVGLQFLKWVSRHGFTINYSTPPGRVESLQGCGLSEGTTTSLSAVGRSHVSRDLLEGLLIGYSRRSINRKCTKLVLYGN